jgi:hypothetical protein
MASWIVHLRIAENLLGKLPALEPVHFAVGNIAPDSGVPDKNWENFDPPYTATHFCEDYLLSLSNDLVFDRKYLQHLDSAIDSQQSSFLWGYFCHLVTDNLWNDIRRSAYENFRPRFDNEQHFYNEVKKDWYGLDHLYVHSHPRCLFWTVFMNCEYRTDCLDLIPEKALRMRVDYIRREYQPDEEMLKRIQSRPFEYLSKEHMDQFVEKSSIKITEWISRLQNGDPSFSNLDSVTQA